METATHPAQLEFAHFVAQADMLAHFLFAILLAMSVILVTSSCPKASPTGA